MREYINLLAQAGSAEKRFEIFRELANTSENPEVLILAYAGSLAAAKFPAESQSLFDYFRHVTRDLDSLMRAYLMLLNSLAAEENRTQAFFSFLNWIKLGLVEHKPEKNESDAVGFDFLMQTYGFSLERAQSIEERVQLFSIFTGVIQDQDAIVQAYLHSLEKASAPEEKLKLYDVAKRNQGLIAALQIHVPSLNAVIQAYDQLLENTSSEQGRLAIFAGFVRGNEDKNATMQAYVHSLLAAKSEQERRLLFKAFYMRQARAEFEGMGLDSDTWCQQINELLQYRFRLFVEFNRHLQELSANKESVPDPLYESPVPVALGKESSQNFAPSVAKIFAFAAQQPPLAPSVARVFAFAAQQPKLAPSVASLFAQVEAGGMPGGPRTFRNS